MISAAPRTAFGTPHQFEVLAALGPFVQQQIEAHRARRRLWFPSELLPADERMAPETEAGLARLRDAARGLPDAVRVGLALNLLTEEGLPHFHRLIAVHFGYDSPWSTWNNLWTAEEDRHGCALRDYVREARLFDMAALERLQYRYIESGFNPDWEGDPYRLLAYTSLQEKATQVAHASVGRACAPYEPRIQRTLAHISGDESRHYLFYREVFGEILNRDPGRALQSLLKVMPALAMPGHNILGYQHMSEVVRRAGIYGPRQYKLICEELLAYWRVAGRGGLDAPGREAQDKLMNVPARLARMADYMEAKGKTRTFSFEFIYNRILELH